VTQQLANLYREILDNSSKHVATLDSELAIIEKYLSLERFRFGERLNFSIKAPENAKNIYLPPLVLQTLVENAVKHGIGQVVDKGSITVDIEKREPGYLALVTNTGRLDGVSESRGTGIKNSRARLGLIYGDKNNFEIKQVANDVQVSFWFSGDSFQ
jgi:LytS/YehU family sensor histidine kinase